MSVPQRRRPATLAAALTVAAAAAIWPATPAQAATAYYVDCAASGNGNGTQASPWNNLNAVNTPTFGAGDQILFKRGTTCNGTLSPKGSGAAGAPIIIDTYGTGTKPHIAGGGAANAVRLQNQQYWEIRNLEVTNTGATAANRRGVYITLQDIGTGTYYRLTNLTVHHVNGDGTKDLGGSSGIHFDVLGSTTKTKFDDVIVDGNEVYAVNRSGINMSTYWKCRASMGWDGCPVQVDNYHPWTRFLVRNNTVHDIGGDGIVMQYTQNGLAEYNVAYDTANKPNRANAAIWVWNADNVTFQFNEAYQTRKLPDNNDGNAFDADYGTDGTTFQYNYSHDNEGGMILFCGCYNDPSGSSNVVVRYNVSQNDKTRIIMAAGTGGNSSFYNNTIYLPAGSTTKIIQEYSSGTFLTLANNIIINHGSGGYDYTASHYTFTNNILYGNHPNGPAGQITADPQLASPGSGGTGLGTLAGYQLTASSPAIGAGRVMPNNGGRDLWGNPVSALCPPDIGAHQRSTPNESTCGTVGNAGFESGSLPPWSAWNSATVVAGNVHSGTYALRVGPAPASAEQQITVAPNTTYRLSGWAKAATAGEQVTIGVKSFGGTETYTTITATTYTSGTLTFTTGSASTQATIYCFKATGAGYGYCDDFTVQAGTGAGAIRGVASGRCVDIPGGNTSDGTQLILWDCHGGANQTWTMPGDGTLRSAGKCLTAMSNSNGAAAAISTCNGSAGQQWTYDPGTRELRTYGRCLDAQGGATSNNTPLLLWTCHGGNNQKWVYP